MHERDTGKREGAEAKAAGKGAGEAAVDDAGEATEGSGVTAGEGAGEDAGEAPEGSGETVGERPEEAPREKAASINTLAGEAAVDDKGRSNSNRGASCPFSRTANRHEQRYNKQIIFRDEGGALNFEEAQNKALAFREKRNWSQFHNPKDLAISISLESAELLEIFQWSGHDLTVSLKSEQAKEELADVVIYCIYMADRLGVSLPDIVSKKIDVNEKKYPVEKSCGNARKYTEL